MLFHEVYSVYFNAVAAILGEAVSGEITAKRITEIVNETAFSESVLMLPPSLKGEEWMLLGRNLQTLLRKPPQMPLTILQKRWLKALLGDPRIALFAPDTAGLEDVDPLFSAEDFIYFDRYADGDPFSDKVYMKNFRIILTALKERRKLKIRQKNRHGKKISGTFTPCKLEYSGKDDKFRLITVGGGHSYMVNVGRITKCELLDEHNENAMAFIPPAPRTDMLTFELTDDRNALERAMLHFSDCRKETRRLENGKYLVTLWYNSPDVTEIVIRILSFGPMVRVASPDSFIALIKERMDKQEKLRPG
ncbi:MAG: WYL domain-containing protein [Clostridiales Family XIII bacterium]|jgi:hypothetical protein|nr:WYL domain-containing protein [Clostridiales Family XIII bacterium]